MNSREAGIQIDKLAMRMTQENPSLTYGGATSRVLADNPDLKVAYAAMPSKPEVTELTPDVANEIVARVTRAFDELRIHKLAGHLGTLAKKAKALAGRTGLDIQAATRKVIESEAALANLVALELGGAEAGREVDRRARQFVLDHPHVSYSAAVGHVLGEDVQLARRYTGASHV